MFKEFCSSEKVLIFFKSLKYLISLELFWGCYNFVIIKIWSLFFGNHKLNEGFFTWYCLIENVLVFVIFLVCTKKVYYLEESYLNKFN